MRHQENKTGAPDYVINMIAMIMECKGVNKYHPNSQSRTYREQSEIVLEHFVRGVVKEMEHDTKDGQQRKEQDGFRIKRKPSSDPPDMARYKIEVEM